ncbi:MAG: hypothetical protein JWQ40_1731 [Segetibacter sp.]|nr:hypothetical protein [Segetibacter sp.]
MPLTSQSCVNWITCMDCKKCIKTPGLKNEAFGFFCVRFAVFTHFLNCSYFKDFCNCLDLYHQPYKGQVK